MARLFFGNHVYAAVFCEKHALNLSVNQSSSILL
jgi:hypothetical protein